MTNEQYLKIKGCVDGMEVLEPIVNDPDDILGSIGVKISLNTTDRLINDTRCFKVENDSRLGGDIVQFLKDEYELLKTEFESYVIEGMVEEEIPEEPNDGEEP